MASYKRLRSDGTSLLTQKGYPDQQSIDSSDFGYSRKIKQQSKLCLYLAYILIFNTTPSEVNNQIAENFQQIKSLFPNSSSHF